MKKLSAMLSFLALSFMVSTNAHAIWVGDLMVGYGLLCAPEVATSNLDKTQNVLEKLAASEEFQGQDKFKQIVRDIAAKSATEEKMDAYLTLVDVKDSEELVRFIGARKSEYKNYSVVLSQNTDLPTDLALIVIDSLTSSLKGSLN